MERRALGRDAKLSRRMTLTVLGLVAVYGGVLVYLTAWAVLWAFYGAPALGLLGFVPVALVLTALGPYRAARRLVGARIVSPEEEPALHESLERLCALAGTPKPRLAIAESDVAEAFAVGVRSSRSVLVVSRGLLSRLDTRETEAVLAHELAHVINRDSAVMTVASYPLYAGSWLVRKVRERPFFLLALFVVWPYVLWAAVLYVVCGALTRSLSIDRELAADRGAAVLTGAPEALASALQKATGALGSIPSADLRRLAPLNALFIIPTSPLARTHPPLAERLAHLGEMTREAGEPEPPRGRSFPYAVVAFAVAFVAALVVFLYVG
jgi:heat shock protein HtpX